MTTFTSARRPLAAALATGLAAFAAPAFSAEEVNVYTYREPGLIKPLFDAFTKDTGIKVNVIFAASGLEQRIKPKAKTARPTCCSPSTSAACSRRRSTASRSRSVSPVLESGGPDGLSRSAGPLVRHQPARPRRLRLEGRVKQNAITYEELADPKWKGKICIRSGQHLYNSACSPRIAPSRRGEDRGMAEGRQGEPRARNPPAATARRPATSSAGNCDIGLGNTYYWALMRRRTSSANGATPPR